MAQTGVGHIIHPAPSTAHHPERSKHGHRIGHRQCGAPVTFSTEEDAASVTEAIESALSAGTPIKLTDDKGRRIIVPANALGYALIGSETKHAVGFGAL